jgi:hypothetical protein
MCDEPCLDSVVVLPTISSTVVELMMRVKEF